MIDLGLVGVGATVSQQITVGAGTPPFNYNLCGSAPGVSVSNTGLVSVTPPAGTTAGEYSFTVCINNCDDVACQNRGDNCNVYTYEVTAACVPCVIAQPTAVCFLSVDPTLNGSTSLDWCWNVGATGAVEYGLTPSLGNSLPQETSTTYDCHSQAVPGLVSGQSYYFQLTGVDAGGNVCAAQNPNRADGLWLLVAP